MPTSARACALPLLAASAASFAVVSSAQAKAPLHRPSLVQTARAGGGEPRFLVSVAPTGSATAQAAQATPAPGCSIFSTSGTCGQEHAIALILYGATTDSLAQAATDAYNIVFEVVKGAVDSTEELYDYVLQDTAIVFNVAQEVEDAALNKIAAILGLSSGATAAPTAPVTPSAPVTSPAPSTPSTPVTTPATPTTTTPLAPVTLPTPVTTGTGTVSVIPAGNGAQAAGARPLATVRVQLGAIGDTALVPVSAYANRRLAQLRRHHGRVRLVQKLTYSVHQPGDSAPDFRTSQTVSRAFRIWR